MDIKKFPTAGTVNDVGSKVAHAPFYGSVVPWSQYTGRKEGCRPVVCKFLIGAVCGGGLIFSAVQDADFQVIRGRILAMPPKYPYMEIWALIQSCSFMVRQACA